MAIKRRRKPKSKALTTSEMEVAIAKYFGVRLHIIVPNISWGLQGMHECDMFLIQRNGYALEVEIKRSKSDLLADFKKGHNHQDRQNRLLELYFAIPKELYDECKNIIPKRAGILTCEKYYNDYHKKDLVYVQTERKPMRNKNARKLTLEEQLKVAKLGTMRIWSLKEKLNKK